MKYRLTHLCTSNWWYLYLSSLLLELFSINLLVKLHNEMKKYRSVSQMDILVSNKCVNLSCIQFKLANFQKQKTHKSVRYQHPFSCVLRDRFLYYISSCSLVHKVLIKLQKIGNLACWKSSQLTFETRLVVYC